MGREQFRCEFVTFLSETGRCLKGDLREYSEFLNKDEVTKIKAIVKSLDKLRNKIDETD